MDYSTPFYLGRNDTEGSFYFFASKQGVGRILKYIKYPFWCSGKDIDIGLTLGDEQPPEEVISEVQLFVLGKLEFSLIPKRRGKAESVVRTEVSIPSKEPNGAVDVSNINPSNTARVSSSDTNQHNTKRSKRQSQPTSTISSATESIRGSDTSIPTEQVTSSVGGEGIGEGCKTNTGSRNSGVQGLRSNESGGSFGREVSDFELSGYIGEGLPSRDSSGRHDARGNVSSVEFGGSGIIPSWSTLQSGGNVDESGTTGRRREPLPIVLVGCGAERIGNGGDAAIQSGSIPESGSALQLKPKRKRRTKAEMEEYRKSLIQT